MIVRWFMYKNLFNVVISNVVTVIKSFIGTPVFAPFSLQKKKFR